MQAFIVLLPLFGAMLAMPIGKTSGHRAAEIVTTSLVSIAAVLAWLTFFAVGFGEGETTIVLFEWIRSGSLQANWAVRVDALSATMMIVITTVSALVHLYSIGYMAEDPSRSRFFAYLSLFTFAMLALVTADNLLQLFFGWEGVGVASYLLIGFWHHKKSANDAAIKAFVVNRVGDVGLGLGIMACYFVFGSVEFDPILDIIRTDGMVQPPFAAEAVHLSDLSIKFLDRTYPAIEIIGVLLFIGAMGKSAQFLLHTWLPDAMEGPTPVSALIHAATMVTAGVFLVCRMSDLYAAAPVASAIVTVIGLTTAIFAATVGLVQTDIKRVIAYSTASQLGYMFFAAGLGGYGAAMFHLTTHAAFKALLFLGAGAVIHFSHHEQDMRNMGGLRTQMPLTFICMMLGTLAITGVGLPFLYPDFAPFPVGFAGFVSKDVILEEAFFGIEAGKAFASAAFFGGLFAAVLTGFYSWRLIFLTFFGKWRAPAEVRKHPHSVPNVMLIPLIPLAIGAVFAGMVFYKPFVGKGAEKFWDGAIHIAHEAEAAYGDGDSHGAEHGADAYADSHSAEATYADDGHADEEHGGSHDIPIWVLWAPLIAGTLGLIAAMYQYLGEDPLKPGLIREGGLLYEFLKNRWYIDRLYQILFQEPARIIGRVLWKYGDEAIIDGGGPNGLAKLMIIGAQRAVSLQTGFVFHYAFVMLLGVIILLSLIVF
ncbi:NADH-quinone oxidoreductase subunit L [Parvularcula lutaonensis]|uniref:NADH-quinone oxidoreductase subunit L n=1 Tax=Parvularcula lutaonensis TaxID=491923 RepID=A0ABV7M7T7_9PROT|nr:NADH-quinone oxidoreductase subunit L [Parvularcula lutaonensis]GGY43067.1 NADH-quinone oxidoreductase subunit L [Parvularcula lutaonensis]